MKKLRITFQNEDGTKKSMALHLANQNLKPQKVYALAVQITELELFEKDGVKLMTKVLSACYVSDGVKVLFSVCRNEAGEKVVFSPMIDLKALEVLLKENRTAFQMKYIFLLVCLFHLLYLPAEKLRRCMNMVFASDIRDVLSRKEFWLYQSASFLRQEEQVLLL